ncbi:tyrosine-protein kinase Wzc [Serratia fonticola]|uniref:Tyrosine-protein kinase Wzc n=1 Tax=Serratia fonticola TaxID=47917 RepID=A0AAJ1YFS2_SERFO|nr:tyrosine-protein kinase Wzc [Serratia fonticola]MDQ9129373.1 tyrosine-protein kinase Wzc [Serratia fonticola]
MLSKIQISNNEANDSIDIGRLVGGILDNRWFILAMIALFAAIGSLYAIIASPVYRADALVQVEQSSGSNLLNNLSEMLPNSQPQSGPEIEIIKSRMVLGKAVQDLDLDTIIERKYFPIFGKGIARLQGDRKPALAVSRFNVPANLLGEQLKLVVVDKENYQLFVNSDMAIDGKVGQLLKDSDLTLLVSEMVAPAGTEFTIRKIPELYAINGLLSKLNVDIKGKDTGIIALSFEDQNPESARKVLDSIINHYLLQNVERKSAEAEKSLDFLKEQLPKVRSALNESEESLNQFRQSNESVDLSLEAKAVLDSVVSLDTQLNELTFKEAEISKLYTKEHPSYRTLMEKRQTLQDEKDNLNKRIEKLPKTQQEILRLTRDVESDQAVYMQLLGKQQELNITKASTVGNVRIIDSAVVQPEPVKPQKFAIIIASIFMGIVLSVGGVALKTIFRNGIESPEQLEELGINVYAAIPLSVWQRKKDVAYKRNSNKNSDSNDLLAIGNPTDIALEAIRSLRTSLHFAMLEAKNNVLMIAGASPNIGKSFVSINLAAVIAQSGQRVLIIDGDMRKGYLHKLVGVDINDGLSEILSGVVSIEKAIMSTSIQGLDFISRGSIPPNPSELLMHTRMEGLLTWASEHYDLILVDTPPILAVTDAAIIGRNVGTSLMVARFEINTPKEIEVSIRRFTQNGIDIRGVILNAVVKKASNKYGNYGYYQYSYENDNNDSDKKIKS